MSSYLRPEPESITIEILLAFSPCLSVISHSNNEKHGSYHPLYMYPLVQFHCTYIVRGFRTINLISTGHNFTNRIQCLCAGPSAFDLNRLHSIPQLDQHSYPLFCLGFFCPFCRCEVFQNKEIKTVENKVKSSYFCKFIKS